MVRHQDDQAEDEGKDDGIIYRRWKSCAWRGTNRDDGQKAH